MLNFIFWGITFLTLVACGGKATEKNHYKGQYQNHYDNNDARFSRHEALLLLDKKPFSGTVKEFRNSSQLTSFTEFSHGIKHGSETAYYRNGNIAYQRHYHQGKRSKEHKGFYSDGSYQFYGRFQNDLHQGDYFRWHNNGQVAEYIFYKEGKEVAHKIWRANGQLYANYIVKNGENIGLQGAKLCNSTLEAKKEAEKKTASTISKTIDSKL